MNPYLYVREATRGGKKLLSLCCGNGMELKRLYTEDVTAVDIVRPYLDALKEKYPFVKTVCSDVLDFLKEQPNDSYDVISIIDGIEHLDKKKGLEVIKQMKRVAKEKILLFTPEGYTRNEPKDTWGIKGGDHFQHHLSGWEVLELKDLGFQLLEKEPSISPHGQPYNAIMLEYVCSQ